MSTTNEASVTSKVSESDVSGVGAMEEDGSGVKLVRAVRLLRLGTWSVFTLFVAALLAVTVVGPFLLGNPAVTGGQPALFGGLLLSLGVGTVVFVVASLLLD